MFTRLSVFLFALLFTAFQPAFATSYYVSPSGSDFFPGTSTLLPWATVAKVNSANLRSGDQVYFLRGGIWRETLVPQTTGLYYGAYGTSFYRPAIDASNALNLLWTPVGTNVWAFPLGSIAPHAVWFNSVLGVPASSRSALGVQNQWYYSQGTLYVYTTSNLILNALNTGIEASQRAASLVVNNVSSLTAEHISFVNGNNVDVLLGTGNSGQETFNDVVLSGAANAAMSVVSGSPYINLSELVNNGMGIDVSGGTGFVLYESLVSGSSYQAVNVSAVNGPSYIYQATISGNSTNSPATPTINNLTTYPLNAVYSVLLPNPFEPKVFNYVGLTDQGSNVYQSPYLQARGAPLIVVPFVDDYINLGVAQAISQVAKSYGCNLSYALNTKLVTTPDWATIRAMQANGVEVVAHTRSHSDLANNNVFSIRYTGTATSAKMTINQTTGLLQTFLNGSTTPDLSISTSNTYNGIIDILSTIPAGKPYQVVIQTNQNYFTPINLANVSQVDIKTAPYMAQANANYLTWEVEGSQSDIAANLPGYQAKAFATPFTSSNLTVETHVQNAGFASMRNGLLNSDTSPDGNWLFSGLDVYNMAAEWLPYAYDATKPASSVGALVEALGAQGGVMAVYSHGYDEFSLQNWQDFFSNLKSLNATCMTMSQANAYVESHGGLVPDGLRKNYVESIQLLPNYAVSAQSPPQGARNLH